MKKLEALTETLTPFAAILDGEQLIGLQTLLSGLKTSLAATQDSGRNLRIAVVGQMKAGKSSFLNAAFFGRDLLPKADTPMTAALTKIVYAPEPFAEVEFYSQQDWDRFKQLASEYPANYAEAEARLTEATPFGFGAKPRVPSKALVDGQISVEIMSAVELIERAQNNALDVPSYLGKIKTIKDVKDTAALTRALHEYVGSGGRFASITKMSVLHINDPRLGGLEIIDTPGFNDPVVSRGNVTRRYLGQCDVIFLLSSISQFIGATEMNVIIGQFPEAGINEQAIFLIGTQRDAALRQDPNIAKTAAKLAEKYPPEKRAGIKVSAMIQLLDKQMGEHARKTLDDQINKQGLDAKTKSILTAINQTPPRFISAWSSLTADNFSSLSVDDQGQLNSLCRDTGYDFDPESLHVLSNIPALRDEVLKQRERKAQLIAGKAQELREGALHGAKVRLKDMRESLTKRSEQILSNNIADLERNEKETVKRLTGGRKLLESVFDEQLTQTSQQFALLKTEVRAQALKYSRVEAVRDPKTEAYEVSTSSWYNPFSWGNTETRYRDIVTVYASVQDAIEQVENFALQSTKTLQKSIMECVDLKAFRKNVAQAATAMFNTEDASYDGVMMLTEVNKSLRKITIPEVNFGDKDYSQNIIKAFGCDRVGEDQISGLKEAQRKAVAAVINDLEAEVDSRVNAIKQSLGTTGKTFVADMSRDIQASLTQLRADIANKEQTMAQIDEALKAVDRGLKSL